LFGLIHLSFEERFVLYSALHSYRDTLRKICKVTPAGKDRSYALAQLGLVEPLLAKVDPGKHPAAWDGRRLETLILNSVPSPPPLANRPPPAPSNPPSP
jgi:hypothetical protein